MSRFNSPADVDIAGEAAAALGLAGERLRKSLDALRAFDTSGARANNPARRAELAADAAEPLLGP